MSKIKISVVFSLFVFYSFLFSNELNILFGASLNGYVEGCACKAGPKSGMLKRGHYIKTFRSSNENTVVLSSGDLFSIYPNQKQAEMIAKVYKDLAYDAILIGDQELVNGLDFLKKQQNQLPLVTSTLSIRGLKKIPESLIVQKAGLNIGILSYTPEKTFRYFREKEVLKKIKFDDSVETLQKKIDDLGEKTDLVILLSHGGVDMDKQLAEKLKGLAVIFGGHNQELTSEPLIVNKVPIVHAGRNGMFQVEMFLKLDGNSVKDYNLRYHFFVFEDDSHGDFDLELVKDGHEFETHELVIHHHYPKDKQVTDIYEKYKKSGP